MRARRVRARRVHQRERMKSPLALVIPLLAAVSLAPGRARACSDAGAPNQTCNDGGAAWIACDAHADCPAGQRCGPVGVCVCGETCARELCDEDGCVCCAPRDPRSSCLVVYACEEPDAGATVDAGAIADAGTAHDAAHTGMDAGPSAPEPRSSGCSVSANGSGWSGWLAGLALVIGLAARRRAH